MRLTISTRTVAVCIAIFACGLAYVESCVRPSRIEATEIERLQQMGLDVQVCYQHQRIHGYFSKYDFKNSKTTPPGNAWARKIWGELAFARVEFLRVTGDVSDTQFLKHFPELKSLALEPSGPIRLHEVGELPKLESFSFESNVKKIDRVDLEVLCNLSIQDLTLFLNEIESTDFVSNIKNATDIYLSAPKVLESSFTIHSSVNSFKIAYCDNLRKLEFDGTRNTGATSIVIESCPSLRHLGICRLPNLVELDVSHCELNTLILEDLPALAECFVGDSHTLEHLQMGSVPNLNGFDDYWPKNNGFVPFEHLNPQSTDNAR